jgi:hypothetical protein
MKLVSYHSQETVISLRHDARTGQMIVTAQGPYDTEAKDLFSIELGDSDNKFRVAIPADSKIEVVTRTPVDKPRTIQDA